MRKLRNYGWAVIFTATVLLAACASHNAGVADTSLMSGPDATMAQLENQTQTMERMENTLVIRQAWLDEREMQLNQREADLDRQVNSLAIQQAWLSERETRLSQSAPDLTKREDMVTFRQAWEDQRQVQVASGDSIQTKVEEGRCYASVFIPAQYRSVAVTKPIELPKGEAYKPVLYQTVTEQVKVADEHMSWEQILCANDKTPTRIVEVQRSLYRGGYNPGPIDGVVGPQTLAAINAFQKDFNLTVANELTIETVDALNIHF